MRRVVAVSVLLVGLAACGGGDDGLRSASDGLFSCDRTAVRVSFDPTTSVSVEVGDAAVATATFTERHVSDDCELVRGAPRTTAKGSPYDDQALIDGIYRPAELDCRVDQGIRIDVHPIFNATTDRHDGSVLLLVDGRTIVVSAVLKNKGDPQASRIYHAPRYCALA